MTGDPDAASGPDVTSDPEAEGGPEADGGLGWLVVIDMQRVFAEAGSPWRAPRFAEITGPVAALAAHFAPRVTFTRFVAPRQPRGAWRDYYRQWPFALQPPGARLYEVVEELSGLAGQTLDAETFGKWGSALAAAVSGAGRLVLAGVSTDCCVLSTALAAADAGLTVAVVADACAGASDASHAQALEVMRLYGPLVEVVSCADILGGRP